MPRLTWPHSTRTLLVTALLLGLTLVAPTARAQPEASPAGSEETADEEPRRAPPPRTGPIFGTPPPQSTAGAEEPGAPEPGRGDAEEDARIELLVLDLDYGEGVRFRETYRERFETSLDETLAASAAFRALGTAERQRRMARAGALLTGEMRDADVARMAQSIGVSHYLIPRIEVADARNYRIRMTFGEVDGGEGGPHHVSRTAGRAVDDVDAALRELVGQALVALE